MWLPTHPDLERFKGKVAPRNDFAGAWQHTLNLSLTQSIPIWHDVDVKLFATMFNFANLLSKSWGIVQNFGQYNAPFGEATVAGTGYNPTTQKYLYTYLQSGHPGCAAALLRPLPLVRAGWY